MSDMGDMYREMREHRQETRRKAYGENQRFVEEMKVVANSTEFGSVLRYRFTFSWGQIDFWPSSGKWMVVGEKGSRTGPRKMVTYATKRMACPQKYV